jgi:lysyl-tRNA synthetase class 2
MVCRALALARNRAVPQVSLNYAGLAHIVRGEAHHAGPVRWLAALVMPPLSRRFQMERLVRFNEKFSPQWRPRYLVYESRGALPVTVVRVLQAEGYLPPRRRLRLPRRPLTMPSALPRSPHARGAR